MSLKCSRIFFENLSVVRSVSRVREFFDVILNRYAVFNDKLLVSLSKIRL